MRFTIRHENEARSLTCNYCRQLFVIPPDTDDAHIQRMAQRHLENDHGATSVGSGSFSNGPGVGIVTLTLTAEVPGVAKDNAEDVVEDSPADDAGIADEPELDDLVSTRKRGNRGPR